MRDNESVSRPLRVLMATETSGGGTGRHVLDLCSALISHGHKIHLVYAPNRAESRFLEEVRELNQHELFSSSSCPMFTAPHLGDLKSYIRILKEIKKFGPFDILHSHSSKAGALLRMAPRKYGRQIYTPHALKIMDPNISTFQKYVYSLIESTLGRYRSDAVISVSPAEREKCVAIGIPGNKVFMVINGVQNSIASSFGIEKSHLGFDEGVCVFGYVGRFAHQKAPERVVDAFLNSGMTNAALIMIGDGPDRETLMSKVAAAGMMGKVHFAGMKSAIPYYHAMDVFVMPSRYESMPYVLLEAAEFGLPIISTEVSGADVVVQNGYNGIIVPNIDDTEILEKAMIAFADETNYENFAAAASKSVGKYSVGTMAKEILSIYRGVLG